MEILWLIIWVLVFAAPLNLQLTENLKIYICVIANTAKKIPDPLMQQTYFPDQPS